MKSTSITKPPKFLFERYPRGGYILWLRENFRESTETDESGETHTAWTYDEYTILMQEPLTDSFIEAHFDEYISEARKKEASDTDTRLAATEDAIAELATLIGGVLNG